MDQDQLASMLTNVINNAAADALSMQLEDIASDARKAGLEGENVKRVETLYLFALYHVSKELLAKRGALNEVKRWNRFEGDY